VAEHAGIAVLWDMDGTLVNTEPLWMAAETELVAAHGGEWTHEQALQLVGNGLMESARILQLAGVRMAELDIIRWLTAHVVEHLDPAAMPWRPGALEFLRSLKDAGIPSALVTMSYRSMAEAIAARAGFDAFDAIVAGDDVAHAKPHPEPYWKGAEALGVPIERCLAIEDSTTGLASAVAAGATVVAVPFLIDIPDSPAYTKWESLDGRGPADVVALIDGRAAA